jgi:2-oxoacid:acceptor oxidoreductase gamma subunit (pyruvate/2-ketoisovalerate family)
MAGPATGSSSAAVTRSTAARASSKQCATESAQLRPSTGSSDAGADRDPLARARGPGREDGIAAARACIAPRRPLRAYTRISDRPIRRHDAIEHPDLVVVLEPSLVSEASIDEGLGDAGLVLVDAEVPPAELAGRRVRCVPASRLAARRGSSFGNLVMVGAVAAVLGEPSLEELQEAAVELLGEKLAADEVRGAVEEGYRWAA